jgi:hypothetical protein
MILPVPSRSHSSLSAHHEPANDGFWCAVDSAVGDFCLRTVVPAKTTEWSMLSEMIGEDWEWTGSQAVLGMAVSLSVLKAEQHLLRRQLEEQDVRHQENQLKLQEERELRRQLVLSKLAEADNNSELAHRNVRLQSEISRLQNVVEQFERDKFDSRYKASI